MSDTTDDDLVPVLLVAYEDDADLELGDGDDPTVENHDDLVNRGQTFDEIRALKRSAVEEYGLDIVEPGSPLWDDRLEDLVYFGDGSASLLKPGTARFEGAWVIGQDWGDNEVAYPAHRVESVHTEVEIPETKDGDVSNSGNTPYHKAGTYTE